MKHQGIIDIEKALLNPASVFDTPEEVLHAKGLSRVQKIEILRRWEYDQRQPSMVEYSLFFLLGEIVNQRIACFVNVNIRYYRQCR
jgi:hypothetical protein